VAILVALGVAAVGALLLVGGLWFANKVEDAVEVTDCPFLSDDRAEEIYGPGAEVQALTGLYQSTLGRVLDNRGLPDATACVVTEGTGAAVSRLAESSGGKAVYDQERASADAVSEDRGGGITVTREGWFANSVEGVGDEAFCTASDVTGAVGILARKGDQVLYVSVQASPDSVPGDLQAGDDGVVRNPTACQRAQEIARAILG
jgi:hypothetical protein